MGEKWKRVKEKLIPQLTYENQLMLSQTGYNKSTTSSIKMPCKTKVN